MRDDASSQPGFSPLDSIMGFTSSIGANLVTDLLKHLAGKAFHHTRLGAELKERCKDLPLLDSTAKNTQEEFERVLFETYAYYFRKFSDRQYQVLYDFFKSDQISNAIFGYVFNFDPVDYDSLEEQVRGLATVERSFLILLLERKGLSVRQVMEDFLACYEEKEKSLAGLSSSLVIREMRATERRIVEQVPRRVVEALERRGLARPGAKPCQLPPDIADFTAREHEVNEVTSLLERASKGEGKAVVISAVAGKPGVGKSALAIHAAHQMKHLFPGGALHVDLRGTDGAPLDPFDVLGTFLSELGDREIPAELPRRIALFRTLLSRKNILVLLDNAHDEAQVRPLIPGCPTCAVLITSRRTLAGLEGVEIVELPLMSEEEALDLLGRLAGKERISRETADAKRIVQFCGRLPLAVRIAGARLKGRQHRKVKEEADDLADERRRLEWLKLTQPTHLDVRASFFLSYRDLTHEEARLFRLLALVPGPDFLPEVASVIEGEEDEEAACERLERLVDAQLLEAIGEGRYRFHDLIALFARERLREEETPDEVEEARSRLADLYIDVLRELRQIIDPNKYHKSMTGVQHGEMGSSTDTRIPSRADILAWFEREQESIAGIVEQAHTARAWDQTAILANYLGQFLHIRSNWSAMERILRLALDAHVLRGDRLGEAEALNNLGVAFNGRSRWDEAIACYTRSLDIYRESAHRLGEAHAHHNLGSVYRDQGDWKTAADCLGRSLTISKQSGDPMSQAMTLNSLGVAYDGQGRWEEAIRCFQESLEICRKHGYTLSEGEALGSLGNVYRDQGRWGEAEDCFQRALSVFNEIGAQLAEGATLSNLGGVYNNQGRWNEAIQCYEQALEIHREYGDKRGEGLTLNNLGNVHNNLDQLDKAIQCYEQSLHIAEGFGDRLTEGRTLSNLGVAYASRAQWSKATECHLRGLEIKRALGDRLGEGQALTNIGSMYWAQGRPEDGIQHYEQALSIFRELGDRLEEGQVLRNLGVILGNIGPMAKAILCCEESLHISRDFSDRLGEASSLNNLGSLYRRQDRLELAKRCFQQSLQIFRERNHLRGEARALGNLGHLYFTQGLRKEAMDCFDKSVDIVVGLDDQLAEADVLTSMASAHWQVGNRREARKLWRRIVRMVPLDSSQHFMAAEQLRLTNRSR